MQSHVTQPHEEHAAILHLRLEILEAERERDQIQATIDNLRARLDRSEDRVTALLAAPEKPKEAATSRRGWWPWRK